MEPTYLFTSDNLWALTKCSIPLLIIVVIPPENLLVIINLGEASNGIIAQVASRLLRLAIALLIRVALNSSGVPALIPNKLSMKGDFFLIQ